VEIQPGSSVWLLRNKGRISNVQTHPGPGRHRPVVLDYRLHVLSQKGPAGHRGMLPATGRRGRASARRRYTGRAAAGDSWLPTGWVSRRLPAVKPPGT
jgi:hypothetical protein